MSLQLRLTVSVSRDDLLYSLHRRAPGVQLEIPGGVGPLTPRPLLGYVGWGGGARHRAGLWPAHRPQPLGQRGCAHKGTRRAGGARPCSGSRSPWVLVRVAALLLSWRRAPRALCRSNLGQTLVGPRSTPVKPWSNLVKRARLHSPPTPQESQRACRGRALLLLTFPPGGRGWGGVGGRFGVSHEALRVTIDERLC